MTVFRGQGIRWDKGHIYSMARRKKNGVAGGGLKRWLYWLF